MIRTGNASDASMYTGTSIDEVDDVEVQAPPPPPPPPVVVVPAPKPVWQASGAGRVGSGSLPPALRELQALPPEQRAERIEQLTQRRTETMGRMRERADQLEGRWRRMSPENREHCLRDYSRRSRHLSPEQRQRLNQRLETAAAARQSVRELKTQLSELEASGAPPKQTAAVKAELATAAATQTQAVEAATKQIDDAGLQVDRLAVTESAIDPAGMGVFGSLFEMLEEVMTLTFTIYAAQITTIRQEQVERKNDEKKNDKRLEDEWRQKDDLKRRLFEELRPAPIRAARGAR